MLVSGKVIWWCPLYNFRFNIVTCPPKQPKKNPLSKHLPKKYRLLGFLETDLRDGSHLEPLRTTSSTNKLFRFFGRVLVSTIINYQNQGLGNNTGFSKKSIIEVFFSLRFFVFSPGQLIQSDLFFIPYVEVTKNIWTCHKKPSQKGHSLADLPGRQYPALKFNVYGCFRKWWYLQIIHFNRDFHYKSSILGYPYFGNTHIPWRLAKPCKTLVHPDHIPGCAGNMLELLVCFKKYPPQNYRYPIDPEKGHHLQNEEGTKYYVWWKTSCTSWYAKYPIIYRVLHIPGG